jgi:predicted transcriptional regulator
MAKELSQEFISKIQKVAQGPDADLLYDMVDLLYERRVEYGGEPLSEGDWAAIREGRSAVARGEFVTLEDLKKDLGL